MSVVDLDVLGALSGRAAAPPRHARQPVSASAIDQWCRALGDRAPCYTDVAFAKASRWQGIIAPPTMLQAWTMHDRRYPEAVPAAEPEAVLNDLVRSAGYVGVVATKCEQVYARPVRIGDKLVSQPVIESIAGPKNTKLGEGYFVTVRTDYRLESGDPIGTMRLDVLHYKPTSETGSGTRGTGHAPSDLPADPLAVIGVSVSDGGMTTRSRGDITLGQELPLTTLYITPTLIAAGAIAGGDYNVLHHDRDRAKAAGSPDIFMNILTSMGLVGRYVTEWLGPEAEVNSVSIRLGVPNHPYDTLVVSGQVVEVAEARKGTVTLEVAGENSLGSHILGTVIATLPEARSESDMTAES
jgi:acyl dehydratase